MRNRGLSGRGKPAIMPVSVVGSVILCFNVPLPPHFMIPFLTWFSALSFLAYGTSCIFTDHMRAEFTRFGLARYRVTVGVTQLAGAMGLLMGFHAPVVAVLSSGGLAFQMLLGVGVRLWIRDSLVQALPAAFYFGINTWLFVSLLRG